MNTQKTTLSILRYAMSFIFLWAFIDKLFGLGFATLGKDAWINGGSPTYGFLMFATKGPLAPFFKSLAGMPVIDWIFMLGLLGIGLSLLLNRALIWGALSAVVMLSLMWFAVLPPANNPIIDEHTIYILVMIILAIYHKEEKKLDK